MALGTVRSSRMAESRPRSTARYQIELYRSPDERSLYLLPAISGPGIDCPRRADAGAVHQLEDADAWPALEVVIAQAGHGSSGGRRIASSPSPGRCARRMRLLPPLVAALPVGGGDRPRGLLADAGWLGGRRRHICAREQGCMASHSAAPVGADLRHRFRRFRPDGRDAALPGSGSAHGRERERAAQRPRLHDVGRMKGTSFASSSRKTGEDRHTRSLGWKSSLGMRPPPRSPARGVVRD